MSAIVSRPSHTWAATHRMLLALVAVAVAAAVTVVIMLMTSAGSSPSPRVQAPGQGQTGTVNQGGADSPNQGQPDTHQDCLQYMGIRPC